MIYRLSICPATQMKGKNMSTKNENTQATTGVQVINLDDPSIEWAEYDMPNDQTPPPATPGQHATVWKSADGRVTVGVWQRDADIGDLLGGGQSFDFFVEGEATVVDANGDEHTARAGDLLIYGSEDSGDWIQKGPIRKIFVHVAND